MKSVKLRVTWSACVPMFVSLIESGSPEGKAMAIEELRKLAAFADACWRAGEEVGVKQTRGFKRETIRRVRKGGPTCK